MLNCFRVIRAYYKLSGVKLWLIAIEFLFLLVPAGASIYSAVLTASVISSITVYDFSAAIYYLSLDFALIVVSALSYFAYHLLSKRVNRQIARNLNEYVYYNLLKNPNLSKISLSTVNNISSCVDFNKNLLYKLCFFLKSIVILGIVFYFSAIIGFGLLTVSIIMGLLLSFSDKKIQFYQKEYSKFQANSLALFNSIQKGSKNEETSSLEARLKSKYFALVDNGSKIKNKIALFYSINNNFISLLLKSAVFGFSVYLILLVKSTTLTLSVFLILIPYLSNSAQNLIAFFELFSEVGLVDNILREFESLSFVSQSAPPPPALEIENFALYFYHVSLSSNNSGTKASVSDVNLKIEFGSLVCFVGDESSGLPAIFKLLTKEEKCTGGSIFLDMKNIYEIPPETYNKIVATAKFNAYFFNLSVQENLKLVCSSAQKISGTLKAFGIYENLQKLPDGMNTIVDEDFDKITLYFLSIARAYLSGAKIICIYGFPHEFDGENTKKLTKILKFLKGKVTTLLFSHSDIFSELCNQTVYVENSKILRKEKT